LGDDKTKHGAYLETMIFEVRPDKSAVQQAIEAILQQPAARLDVAARRERTKAAMVLECTEKGYAAAKIAAVAKRAQISTASIYRDFGDRDNLLLEALQLAIGIFAQNWVQENHHSTPIERIEAMLMTHGRALADPFMGWLFRLYVHLANTSAPQLFALGRAARDANLELWLGEIASLEANGYLVATDHNTTVALLLGAIERRTIFARMAFGEGAESEPDLAVVAKHMSLALFQVYGTAKFWPSRIDKSANGLVLHEEADHGQLENAPISLLDLPSVRLKAFAERTLARDINRLDSESRKVRIQLAAMLECMEMGYEASTMASVATRAGVSTATFYNDYSDKRALFIDAMLMQARFRVDYTSLVSPDDSPSKTIADLVYSISYVLGDPDFLWFHEVSMASEISDAPLLIASSRATRTHTEGFWLDYLNSLADSGLICICDHRLTMNVLLGATQRRSVLSMVFFGKDDVSYGEISRLALASTDFVMRLVAPPTPD
jgi:AcrR family transcriptional regulator